MIRTKDCFYVLFLTEPNLPVLAWDLAIRHLISLRQHEGAENGQLHGTKDGMPAQTGI